MGLSLLLLPLPPPQCLRLGTLQGSGVLRGCASPGIAACPRPSGLSADFNIPPPPPVFGKEGLLWKLSPLVLRIGVYRQTLTTVTRVHVGAGGGREQGGLFLRNINDLVIQVPASFLLLKENSWRNVQFDPGSWTLNL